MENREIVLTVDNLKQYFKINRKLTVKAVDGVSFNVYKGETFSIVGESGSGKTTLGRSIIRIYKPTSGSVLFKGHEIAKKLSRDSKKFLRNNMQMIFQDPMASLNPRKKVEDIVAQGLDVYNLYKTKDERYQKVKDILSSVGLLEEHITRYPHQFSGGQRQRIGIARSLVMNPEFIIADEPISALDVSIQAQIINLMKKLQKERELTTIFIAHDLSMVKYVSDRVAVMHLGHIVEMGTVEDIYENPIHPYTKSLLSAIPLPNPKYERVRKRETYEVKNAKKYTLGKMNKLNETHSVLATEDELKKWI